MKHKTTKYFILLLMLSIGFALQAQSINIVGFDTSITYAPGSSVSVIINPTDTFKINNNFVLELSDVDGTWANPQMLTTINEFYTPLMNATLPSNLVAGNYKLRIRSTHPAKTETTTGFSVGAATAPTLNRIVSGFSNSTNYFNCINCDGGSFVFGSHNQSENASTSSLNIAQKQLRICGFDATADYSVRMHDVLRNTQIAIARTNGNFYIPDNLELGTYVFELTKTKNNVSSVYSVAFLFHGNSTSLGNATSEAICVGSSVGFNIDRSMAGIGRNYMGTKYEVNFGDGGQKIVYTQAQLMKNPTIEHVYLFASCSENSSYFIVSMNMFSKAIFGNCNEYVKNGGGVTKRVNASSPPIAEFMIPEKWCATKPIRFVNKSIPGFYGTSGCKDASNFYWYVKAPGETEFSYLSDGSYRADNNDLLLPEGFLNQPGCWEIMLEAQNQDLCQTISQAVKTMIVEAVPTPLFEMNNNEICVTNHVVLKNKSNVSTTACSRPAYEWQIEIIDDNATEPYYFVRGNASSQDEIELRFNHSGIYAVRLKITNACGQAISTVDTIRVLGNPEVKFNNTSLQSCVESNENYQLDFSDEYFKPVYSEGVNKITSYRWSIDGDNVKVTDYQFVENTNAFSEFPVINFKSSKNYRITIAVEGSCGTEKQAIFNLNIKNKPKITLAQNNEIICSGNFSQALPLMADRSEVVFEWTIVTAPNLQTTATNGAGTIIPSAQFINTGTQSVFVNYQIVAKTSDCQSETFIYSIEVLPKAKLKAIDDIFVHHGETLHGIGFEKITEGQKLDIAWANDNSSIGLASVGTDNIPDFVAHNPSNQIISGLITVVPTIANGSQTCIGDTLHFRINVYPRPSILAIDNQILCANDSAIITFATNNIGVEQSYEWTSTNPAIGLESSGIGEIRFLTTNNTQQIINSRVTVKATITVNGIRKVSETVDFEISILPKVGINNSNPILLCNGETFDGLSFSSVSVVDDIDYAWTNSNTAIGLAASGQGALPSFVTQNDTPLPLKTTITVQATTLHDGISCQGLAKTFDLTVLPKITMQTVQSRAVCPTKPIYIQFDSPMQGGTMKYEWNNDNIATGLAASGIGNISFEASNDGLSPIISTVNVRPIFTLEGHVCYGEYQTFSITVRPKPQVVLVSDKVVCHQEQVESIDFFTLNTGITMSYRWTNSNPEIGLPASGEGPLPAFVATNKSFSFVKAKIHVQPIVDGVAEADCLCEGMDFYITVNPSAHVNDIENQVLCSGENFQKQFTTSNTCGTNTFVWYNDNPNIGLENNGNSNISFEAINISNITQTANITVVPSFELEGKSCNGNAKTFTITVLPKVEIEKIADATFCNLEQFAGIRFETKIDNENISYRWTNSNVNIGLAASGMGALPAFIAQNNGLENIEAQIEVVAVYTHNDIECQSQPIHFKITVNKSPKINASTNVNVCKGAESPRIRFEAYNGIAPYRITYQINKGAIQTINASSADNSVSFTVPTNNEGRFVYRILSVSDANTTACVNTVNDSTVVIISSNPIIDQQPLANQLLCLGATPEALMVAYSGGAGNAHIQWFSNTKNENFGGTIIPSANEFIFQPAPTITVGEYYYYAVITLAGESCSLAVTQMAKITVVPDPVLVLQPLALQSICVNGDIEPLTILASGGIGTYSYQWYRSEEANFDNLVQISSATQASYTPPTTEVGKWYYVCIVKQNALSCEVISEFSKVEVMQNPILTSSFATQSICLNEQTPILEVSHSGSTSAANYQWYTSLDNQHNQAVAIQGARAAQFQPSFNRAGNYFYFCIISFDTNTCANVVSDVAQISVRQHPIINDITTTISSGQTFDVQPQTNAENIVPVGTQYVWELVGVYPDHAVLGASDELEPQNNISQTLRNTLGVNARVEYRVTPFIEGCTGNSFILNVEVKATLTVDVAQVDNTCFGNNDGSLRVTVVGGMPYVGRLPYQILWTYPNGVQNNEAAIDHLYAGEYHLLVRDSLGLEHRSSHIILQNVALKVAFANVKPLDCSNANDASIESVVAGGTMPYRYSWKKNNLPFSTEKDLQQLESGVYQLTVIDASNCVSTSENLTIEQPEVLLIEMLSKIDNTCFGNEQGAISVNVTGGTALNLEGEKYSFSWTGPNAFVSNKMNINNLMAGEYQLEVKDALGCSAYFKASIAQPTELKVTSTIVSESCYGSNDASVSIHAEGGVPPYSATWSNFATGMVQNNLTTGEYQVTVKDANNCSKTISINIVKDSVFSINPVVTQITGNGQRNASIVLNISSKYPNVQVRWTDNPSAGNARYNLAAGIYSVNITNGTSCEINESFAIYEPSAIRIAGTVEDALSCSDQNTGTISLTVSGGTAPYSYLWSNGATTDRILNLDGGEYFVTVTDANGISAIEQFKVVRPLPMKIHFDTEYNVDPNNNLVTRTQEAKVSGGMPPYKYQWADGITHTNNQKADFYESKTTYLKVIDALGCEKTQYFNVDVPRLAIQYESMGCASLDYSFSFEGPDYLFSQPQFLWEFGDGSKANTRKPTHTYAATGNYGVKLHVVSAQVTYTFEMPLYVNSIPNLVLDRTPVICNNDSLMLTVNGANSYLWSDGTTGNRMMLSKPGDYFVIGKSLAGCTTVLSFKATLHNEMNFIINSDKDYVTPESPTVRLWTEKSDSCVYAWDFGNATFVSDDHGHEVVHTFNVTKPTPLRVKLNVTSPEGCVEIASKQLFALSGDLPNTFTPNGDGVNDLFMKDTHIEIYNSKGVLLFKGDQGWDGTYKGNEMPVDTYYYILLFYTENAVESKPGFITIIR